MNKFFFLQRMHNVLVGPHFVCHCQINSSIYSISYLLRIIVIIVMRRCVSFSVYYFHVFLQRIHFREHNLRRHIRMCVCSWICNWENWLLSSVLSINAWLTSTHTHTHICRNVRRTNKRYSCDHAQAHARTHCKYLIF